MRTCLAHGAVIASMIAAAASLSGCCATCSDRETAALIETLDVAGTIGSARHLAKWSQVDLGSATYIPESDKADIRARAQILNAHADKLSDALDRFDPSGDTNKSITLENLKVRGRALDAEYQTVYREWTVWQVRHGRKQPTDVFEYADVKDLIEADER
jgi:hypothetical protein